MKGWNITGVMPHPGKDAGLSAKRFQLLCQQILAEMRGRWGDGPKSGAITRAAEKLDIQQGHFSQIIAGLRWAKMETIVPAAERIGVDLAFFTDASLGDEPDYHRFLKSEKSKSGTMPIPSPAGPQSYAEAFGLGAELKLKQWEMVAIRAGLKKVVGSEEDVRLAVDVMRKLRRNGATEAAAIEGAADVVAAARARREAEQLRERQESSNPPPPRGKLSK